MISRHKGPRHQGHTILPTPPHTESSVSVNSVREKEEERLYLVIGHVIGHPPPPRPGFARLFSVGRALLLAVALKLVPVIEHVEEALELHHLLVRRLGVLASLERCQATCIQT